MKNVKIHQLARYANICWCIENMVQAKKEKIRDFCVKKNNDRYLCISQIEKDIYALRNEFDAPIVYNKIKEAYRFTEKYSFWPIFFNELQSMTNFPEEIILAIHEITKSKN